VSCAIREKIHLSKWEHKLLKRTSLNFDKRLLSGENIDEVTGYAIACIVAPEEHHALVGASQLEGTDKAIM
jgi:hypothetical protein